jgi:tetratricopeptide (TPR) repeat protein
MTPELEAKLQGLEEQLAADPESEELREEILYEYLAVTGGEPRRIHHAVEYIRRFPRTVVARAPFVHVDQAAFPDAFAQVEQEWIRLRAGQPSDPELAHGHAALVASSDRERAVGILDEALKQNPKAPGLWFELGRICPEPARRLDAFQRARALGAAQPNLLTWLARAAIEAADPVAAEQAANELLAQVAEARSIYGDKLDWPERGRDLWARARSTSDSEATAQTLVGAINDHAYRKHWAHTTLGVVAARNGDAAKAIQHLRESASVGSDFRLSSYGPSFLLARELCALGEWDAAADYLDACAAFWNPEPLQDWVRQLRERQMPERFEN